MTAHTTLRFWRGCRPLHERYCSFGKLLVLAPLRNVLRLRRVWEVLLPPGLAELPVARRQRSQNGQHTRSNERMAKKRKKNPQQKKIDKLNDWLTPIAAPDSLLLDTRETSVTNNVFHYTPQEIEALNLMPWKGEKVGNRLRRCAENKIQRFIKDHCVKAAKPLYFRCKLKICPVCSNIRRAQLIEQYKPLVESFQNSYFMTLTRKNTMQFDDAYVKAGQRHWQALKLRFKRNGYDIQKGIFSREVTHHAVGDIRRDVRTGKVLSMYTEQNAGFHDHLHIIYDGKPVPKEVLKEWWLEITKDSSIVDIVPLRGDPGKVLAYLLKYMTKNNNIRDINALTQYLIVTKNRHAIRTFGVATPKKIPKLYCCKHCRTIIRRSQIRDLLISTLPPSYAIIYQFPYYFIPEHAPERQHVLEKKEIENPMEFKTGTEVAFLQAFTERKELSFEELSELFGDDVNTLLEKHLTQGNIFEIKAGRYRILE
jgi:hypothetical protein